MSEAAHWDISIDQGADFSVQLYWTDGASNPFTVLHPMRMDIRAETGQVLYTLTSGTEDEDNPDIRYNSDSGLIQLSIPAFATNMFPTGSYSYDLFVTYADPRTSKTYRKRLIYGSVYVYGKVTADD